MSYLLTIFSFILFLNLSGLTLGINVTGNLTITFAQVILTAINYYNFTEIKKNYWGHIF
jgi:F0F1-type ATP synthase membrane subunit a